MILLSNTLIWCKKVLVSESKSLCTPNPHPAQQVPHLDRARLAQAGAARRMP